MPSRSERLHGPVSVLERERVRIPDDARELEPFRAWARSDRFPQRGRIDFLDGDVEIDMSPEDLYTHSAVKTAIAGRLYVLVEEADRGNVFIDRARVSSPAGSLSVEPDVVVVLWESLDAGRVRHIPAASKKEGRYIELEGAPDLVVEVLSDSSQRKDRDRLPPLYARAGVRELWQVDARRPEPGLSISILETSGYRRAVPDAEGWLGSPVLGASFRLQRLPRPHGTVRFRLEHRHG
jgi:Uma2 family endonuclease